MYVCTSPQKLDGILGGYSLHILQPPRGEGEVGVVGKLTSELRRVTSFSFSGGGGVLGKLRSELRKES